MADQPSMKERLLEEHARLGPQADPASRRRLEEVDRLLREDARVNPAMRHAPAPRVCRVRRLRDDASIVINQKDFNETLHAQINGPAPVPAPVPTPEPDPPAAEAVEAETDEEDDDLDELDTDVLDELDKPPPTTGRGSKRKR